MFINLIELLSGEPGQTSGAGVIQGRGNNIFDPETSLTAKESPMQIFYFTPLFSPFIACAARINK